MTIHPRLRCGLARIAALIAAGALSGCVTPPMPPAPAVPTVALGAEPPGLAADRLSSDLTAVTPSTGVLDAQPVGRGCGSAPLPVVRMTLAGPLLFATDSDLPLPQGAALLDQAASIIRRDAPDWQVTILGHTDAVGTDAYNMDLSRRRAAKVLRALIDRGIDPARLSAVAIGKRQPIASDTTPSGRQQNRRVEFLVSECLGANLGLMRQTGGEGLPVQILRLDPSYGLAPVGSVTLRSVAVPAAAAAPAPPPARAPLRAPATLRPLPTPRYQPNTLSPAVQPNILGPEVPY